MTWPKFRNRDERTRDAMLDPFYVTHYLCHRCLGRLAISVKPAGLACQGDCKTLWTGFDRPSWMWDYDGLPKRLANVWYDFAFLLPKTELDQLRWQRLYDNISEIMLAGFDIPKEMLWPTPRNDYFYQYGSMVYYKPVTRIEPDDIEIEWCWWSPCRIQKRLVSYKQPLCLPAHKEPLRLCQPKQ